MQVINEKICMSKISLDCPNKFAGCLLFVMLNTYIFYVYFFFWPQVEVPPSILRFYSITQ